MVCRFLLACAACVALLCSTAWAQPATGAAVPPTAAPAAAATPAELLARLPAADFAEKTEIAMALAASKDARASLILQALADANLFVAPGGRILIGPHDGAPGFADALSGAPVS